VKCAEIGANAHAIGGTNKPAMHREAAIARLILHGVEDPIHRLSISCNARRSTTRTEQWSAFRLPANRATGIDNKPHRAHDKSSTWGMMHSEPRLVKTFYSLLGVC